MLGDLEPIRRVFASRNAISRTFPQAPLPSTRGRDRATSNEERRGEVEEKFGTFPAIAIGYTLPAARHAGLVRAAMLDHVLHGGRAGRVYRTLVLEEQIAVDAGRQRRRSFDTTAPRSWSADLHKPEFTSEGTWPSTTTSSTRSSRTESRRMSSIR